MIKKRALVSVSNKDGLLDFVNKLSKKFNYEIISTGGTRDYLKKAGIKTKKISDITDFPEILDGRVKTLHPKIHAAVLANKNNPEHMNTLKKLNINNIDLLVVNLYPFEKVSQENDSTPDTIIENIDIGGHALLRSAAKNFEHITIVSSPDDYLKIIEIMENNKGNTTLELRKELALKAFILTSNYDTAIYQKLSNIFEINKAPDTIKLELNKVHDLRYGENPHQSAAFYVESKNFNNKLPFEILQGKQLSYNNMMDITSALRILNEFKNTPCAVVVKHNNPCGVAIGESDIAAYKKAFNADPISAFGGVIGLSGIVDAEMAQLATSIFLEIIVANGFTEEAKSILASKKNLRLIQVDLHKNLLSGNIYRQVAGGVLVQNRDTKMITDTDLKVVTSKKPTKEQLNDLLFSWKVVKHVTSNAIVIAKNGQTIGIGCGQTSRIGAMEIALRQASDESNEAVVASDAFFPSIDNIQAAAQSHISAIIQPGGSIKDKEVIAASEKLGISMIFTGIRHFKH